MKIDEIKEKIKTLIGEDSFRKADLKDIKDLRKLNLPEYFIDFLENFEPKEKVYIGDFRFLPIKDILAENKDYVPGAYIYHLGFTVFASTIIGDVYCFDMKQSVSKESNIYLVKHDILFENTSYNFVKSKSELISKGFIGLISRNIKIHSK